MDRSTYDLWGFDGVRRQRDQMHGATTSLVLIVLLPALWVVGSLLFGWTGALAGVLLWCLIALSV